LDKKILKAEVIERPEVWEFTCPDCGHTEFISYYAKSHMYVHPTITNLQLGNIVCPFCRALLKLSFEPKKEMKEKEP
jgi:transcription elongation factor Elf1